MKNKGRFLLYALNVTTIMKLTLSVKNKRLLP